MTTITEIIRQTNVADPSPAAIERLGDYVEEHGLAEFERIGNMSDIAVGKVLDSVKFTFLTDFGVRAQMRALESALQSEGDSPLERLLIDNILLCWVRYHIVEMKADAANRTGDGDIMAFWDRCVTLGQRRYLRAIESLARLRRLLRAAPGPAMTVLLKQQILGGVQNNIGDNRRLSQGLAKLTRSKRSKGERSGLADIRSPLIPGRNDR